MKLGEFTLREICDICDKHIAGDNKKCPFYHQTFKDTGDYELHLKRLLSIQCKYPNEVVDECYDCPVGDILSADPGLDWEEEWFEPVAKQMRSKSERSYYVSKNDDSVDVYIESM